LPPEAKVTPEREAEAVDAAVASASARVIGRTEGGYGPYTNADWQDFCAVVQAYHATRAQLAAADADTRRLDWLVWNGWVGRLCDEDSYNPDDGDAVLAAIRAAIDAAIALTPEETR
jgi:hypothetical protein